MRRTLALALAGLTFSSGALAAGPASSQAFHGSIQRVQYYDPYYGGGYYAPRSHHRGYYGGRGYYDRPHYGYAPRRQYDRGYYRQRDRSGEAALAAGIVGLALGAAIASSNQRSRHYGRSDCYRYRSYDPRDGTYIGYDGRIRYCR